MDRALRRVMIDMTNDETEVFKQFLADESFRRWLADTVFGIAYEGART
jgi:type I restriction enzyme, R subunit